MIWNQREMDFQTLLRKHAVRQIRSEPSCKCVSCLRSKRVRKAIETGDSVAMASELTRLMDELQSVETELAYYKDDTEHDPA